MNFKIEVTAWMGRAITIEEEHGPAFKYTDVTAGKPIVFEKIALAHFGESPKYYVYLEKDVEEPLRLDRIKEYGSDALVEIFKGPPDDQQLREISRNAFSKDVDIAEYILDAFNVDKDKVPVEDFRAGMQVEFEHGKYNVTLKRRDLFKIDEYTNVTDDDLIDTARITLAHFRKGRNYYRYLTKMEYKMEDERGGRVFEAFTPSILSVANACRRNSNYV